MHKYHGQISVGAATMVSHAPVQPPPITQGNLCPTWFKMKPVPYKTLPSPLPQGFSVETKFWKYTSGEVSSMETDILQFWEVRSFQLNGTVTQSSNRPIIRSFRCCLQLRWTISQSREHLYLASTCSRQQRRLLRSVSFPTDLPSVLS